jgi:hypothetical protein
MTKRAFAILVFVLGVVGMIAVFLVPEWVPANTSWWGRLLLSWDLFVRDRGSATGAGVLLKALVAAAVTFVVLLPAMFVVISKGYTLSEKRWAYGTVGTIAVAWVKALT